MYHDYNMEKIMEHLQAKNIKKKITKNTSINSTSLLFFHQSVKQKRQNARYCRKKRTCFSARRCDGDRTYDGQYHRNYR